MLKKLSKNIITLSVLSFFLFSLVAIAPLASANDSMFWGDGANVTKDSIQGATSLGNKDPRAIAAAVIKVMLGFLGIIAVLIILYAGFLWMTAAGNEDKITQAKGMMSAGVIGLIIILAAFGIATFVMNALVAATA